MPAIFEVRVLGHLVDVKDAARGHLLLGEFAFGLAAGIVFQPLSQHGVGLHLHVMRQPVRYFPQVKTYTMLGDRKSTRLNSSHLVISYAVFCLKKKKKPNPLLLWVCILITT